MLPGAMFPTDNSIILDFGKLAVGIASVMCYTLLAGAAVLTAMASYLINGALYRARQLEQHGL